MQITIWTDGACRPDTRSAAIGVSARDDHGRVFEISRRLDWARDPQTVEVAAIVEALDLAGQGGYRSVRLFIDSRSLAEIANGRATARAPVTRALADIIARARTRMSLTIKWVPRDRNRQAHRLAQRAMYAH